MKVSFQTKIESKQIQQEAFLKLNGSERFYRFLELMMFFKKLPIKQKRKEKKDNFLIVIDKSK